MADNWRVDTDDYDLYGQGDTPGARQGSPIIEENGTVNVDQYYFPMSTVENSTMDQDPNNTGPTNDFWTDYPISIDINGYIFYNGENTGINLRGPAGASFITYDNLTPAQLDSLKGNDGTNGINGTNGVNGVDGKNGLSAYEVWLQENGWLDDPEDHPLSDFYAMLADMSNLLIKEGRGVGSLLVNDKGDYNTADGRSAFASGYYTNATGQYSFTAGNHTTAGYENQIVFGYYNNNKQTSIFEIGNGTNATHSNALELSYTGALKVSSTITDGYGNILSNKVDKISGKGLSTNDFTDSYKSFLDNYHIDTSLSTQSNNPVTNAAITTAINQIVVGTSKPNQAKNTSNNFCGFLRPTTLADSIMNTAYYDDELLWNPNTHSIKFKNNTASGSYTFALGQGTATTGDTQFIIGRYNNPVSGDLFEVGNGNALNPSNAFRVTSAGNIISSGTITDGTGNVLSNKQNTLLWDTEPTENSTAVVNSGDLYDYLVAHGLDPEHGFVVPEVAILRNQVAALTARVVECEAIIASFGNPREIIDDTYTYNTYVYGIDKDEFYIKLKEEEEVEEE